MDATQERELRSLIRQTRVDVAAFDSLSASVAQETSKASAEMAQRRDAVSRKEAEVESLARELEAVNARVAAYDGLLRMVRGVFDSYLLSIVVAVALFIVLFSANSHMANGEIAGGLFLLLLIATSVLFPFAWVELGEIVSTGQSLTIKGAGNLEERAAVLTDQIDALSRDIEAARHELEAKEKRLSDCTERQKGVEGWDASRQRYLDLCDEIEGEISAGAVDYDVRTRSLRKHIAFIEKRHAAIVAMR